MINKIVEITFIIESGEEETVESFQIRIVDISSRQDSPKSILDISPHQERPESEVESKLKKRLEHWGYKPISGSGEIRENDAIIVIDQTDPLKLFCAMQDGTKITGDDPGEFIDKLVDGLFLQSVPSKKRRLRKCITS